jgi:hypothetical protein
VDKETLSNYGWIVICTLVLAVMLALATPFGEFIRDGVWSTTNGLNDTLNKNMEIVGLSGSNGGDNNTPSDEPEVNGLQFGKKYILTFDDINEESSIIGSYFIFYENGSAVLFLPHNDETTYLPENSFSQSGTDLLFNNEVYSPIQENGKKLVYQKGQAQQILVLESAISTGAIFSGNTSYSWEELKNEFSVTDTKIGYAAFKDEGIKLAVLPDGVVTIEDHAFRSAKLAYISLPSTITTIGDSAFYNCRALPEITFRGTMAQWNAISKNANWNSTADVERIICTDGTITL